MWGKRFGKSLRGPVFLLLLSLVLLSFSPSLLAEEPLERIGQLSQSLSTSLTRAIVLRQQSGEQIRSLVMQIEDLQRISQEQTSELKLLRLGNESAQRHLSESQQQVENLEILTASLEVNLREQRGLLTNFRRLSRRRLIVGVSVGVVAGYAAGELVDFLMEVFS